MYLQMLAPSFMYFLEHMHEVRFLGMYSQLSWRDLASGFLNAEQTSLQALHRALPPMAKFDQLVAQSTGK